MNNFFQETQLVKFPFFAINLWNNSLSFHNLKQSIFITILILAETHFGATWPFFLNRLNFDYIKENKINLIFCLF